MALLASWPATTDDTGTKTDGTILDAALFAAIKAAILADIQSATNPTVAPKTITDEVITARGSKSDLSTYLLVAHNADGTLKAISGQASTTQLAASLGAGNWLANPDFLIWPAGDAAAPSYWTLNGAGASVARVGTGLGDTTTKVGPYSAKVTRAAADANLVQKLLNTTSFGANGLHLKGTSFGFGAWVKTSIGSHARLQFNDGSTTSESSYHTGGGDWEWLTGTHVVDSGATYLALELEVNGSAGDAYVSGATALPGLVAPSNWVPCPTVYGTLGFTIVGTVTTGDNKNRVMFSRPGLLKDVALAVVTAPTGAALIVDFDVYDSAAWNSPFATRPQIAISGLTGAAQPDGTYRYRCLAGGGGVVTTNNWFRFNVDQVGSGVAGAQLDVMCRILQYMPPQECLKNYADIGA